MAKVNITEEEICKKEAEFYLNLHAKVEALRRELWNEKFPIERLNKEERIPMEIDLLNAQFKSLNENIMRICGEMHHRAHHKNNKDG